MARIFMGAGDYTAARCRRLHILLNQAFSLIGGSQQPCHCDHAGCGCSEDIGKEEGPVNDIAMEIVKALLDDPSTLRDRGEESAVPRMEDMFDSIEQAAKEDKVHQALDHALEDKDLAPCYVQDILHHIAPKYRVVLKERKK